LKKYIEDSEALWTDGTDTLPCTAIGSVIGTHAGPGAVAVAFFKSTDKTGFQPFQRAKRHDS